MEISKEEFLAYENVRVSGVTNMWAVNDVCELSNLDREQVMFIMKNYSKLKDAFCVEEGK